MLAAIMVIVEEDIEDVREWIYECITIPHYLSTPHHPHAIRVCTQRALFLLVVAHVALPH